MSEGPSLFNFINNKCGSRNLINEWARGCTVKVDGKVFLFVPSPYNPPSPKPPSVISCCGMGEVENMCNAWCRLYLAPLSCSKWLQMHEVVASLALLLAVSLGVNISWCGFIFRDSLFLKAPSLFCSPKSFGTNNTTIISALSLKPAKDLLISPTRSY